MLDIPLNKARLIPCLCKHASEGSKTTQAFVHIFRYFHSRQTPDICFYDYCSEQDKTTHEIQALSQKQSWSLFCLFKLICRSTQSSTGLNQWKGTCSNKIEIYLLHDVKTFSPVSEIKSLNWHFIFWKCSDRGNSLCDHDILSLKKDKTVRI